jgi:hypothetical protein
MHVHIHNTRFIKKRKVSSHYVAKDNGNLLIRSLPERKFLNYLLLIKMKLNRSKSKVSFVIVFSWTQIESVTIRKQFPSVLLHLSQSQTVCNQPNNQGSHHILFRGWCNYRVYWEQITSDQSKTFRRCYQASLSMDWRNVSYFSKTFTWYIGATL